MQDMKHRCVYRVAIFFFYCFDSYIYYLISIVPMNVIIGVGVGVCDGICVGDDVGIVVGIRLGARMRLCVGIGVG